MNKSDTNKHTMKKLKDSIEITLGEKVFLGDK
jgi:hypothetical protein